MRQIRAEQIEKYKAAKLAAGSAPSTVHNHLRFLRQTLQRALEWGYIRENPADKVEFPKIPHKEMEYLDAGEVRAFLERIPASCQPFYQTAITTGLRLGEMLAMKWENIDWDKRQYWVRESLTRARTFDRTKTDNALPVDLTPLTLEALTAHRQRLAMWLLKDPKAVDRGLLFPCATGGPYDIYSFTKRYFYPLLKDAGIRRIRFHDLRHTCVALLISQDTNPKYIQSQLRHASIQMTLDRYGHLFPSDRQKTAAQLDVTIQGAPRSNENLTSGVQ